MFHCSKHSWCVIHCQSVSWFTNIITLNFVLFHFFIRNPEIAYGCCHIWNWGQIIFMQSFTNLLNSFKIFMNCNKWYFDKQFAWRARCTVIFLIIFYPLIELIVITINRISCHPSVSFTLNLDWEWLNAIFSVKENYRMATF